MKILRYVDNFGSIRFGAMVGDGQVAKITGNFGDFEITDEPADIQRVMAPVDARVIFGIGLNYKEHAAETGKQTPEYPMVFMKNPSALQHPGQPIAIPRHLSSDKVDYEGELAVVIGRVCKNVSKEEALDYVLGYTCANDVSARDWQYEWGGGQFVKGKSFDTFCPLGPCLVTTDELRDPGNLIIRTVLNNMVVQESSTSDMIFSVAELIAFLSGSTTLLPGTVILTGTPSGVGMAHEPPRFMKDGDTVSVEIEGIGLLENPVFEEIIG